MAPNWTSTSSPKCKTAEPGDLVSTAPEGGSVDSNTAWANAGAAQPATPTTTTATTNHRRLTPAGPGRGCGPPKLRDRPAPTRTPTRGRPDHGGPRPPPGCDRPRYPEPWSIRAQRPTRPPSATRDR